MDLRSTSRPRLSARVLLACALVSLLVHGAFLLAPSGDEPAAAASSGEAPGYVGVPVEFMEARPAPSASASTERRKQPARVEQRPPTTQAARPDASSALRPAPGVSEEQPRSSGEVETAANDASTTESPSSVEGAVTGMGATQAGPSSQPSSGGTASSAPNARPVSRAPDELHAQLSSTAKRCYPPAAERLRIRGEAVLSFCVDERGAAMERNLERSTGHSLLDRAVTGCVLDRAGPLRAPAGCYRVPVRFR